MLTRSSSNLPVESPLNPSTSNPKRRNHKRSKQPFILEESPVDTMADQRTMAELLRAPTEGYVKAIVVPLILAEQFELKHSLINMMTSDLFFGLEKDNPHDHILWGNPSVARKRTPLSILTWEDLAWDRYKDLLRACPHHGFTELHQLDTFYNALNPANQDSLNYAAGGNLLERRTQDVLTIIKNKSKCLSAGGNTFSELRDNIQGYVAAAAINYNQGNSGYRMANQNRPSGFAQPNVQNNQNRFGQPQGYNRGNNFNQEQSYQAATQQNQVVPLSELEKIKRVNEANMKAMQTQINNVKNELRNEMKNWIQASMSNQTNDVTPPKMCRGGILGGGFDGVDSGCGDDGDRVVFVVVGLWWGMMVLRSGGDDNDGYKVVVPAVDGDEGESVAARVIVDPVDRVLYL
uniref:Reverse transcriptase domain-containing protein n=1 Tax=Tanacetum cinerariifolium TaxID=118510 RepID=A0A6L2N7P0_TANCI|nr:hypothetical protein [Tanacetum cinerariifolium]